LPEIFEKPWNNIISTFMSNLMINTTVRKKDMVFEVNVNLAESCLYGVAKGINGNYAINIQGGRSGIALPKELLNPDRDSYAEALLNIRTNSGTVSLRSRVQSWKGYDRDF
jgi:hypothetical protein